MENNNDIINLLETKVSNLSEKVTNILIHMNMVDTDKIYKITNIEDKIEQLRNDLYIINSSNSVEKNKLLKYTENNITLVEQMLNNINDEHKFKLMNNRYDLNRQTILVKLNNLVLKKSR